MELDPFLDLIPESTFHREEAMDQGRVVMQLGGELDMYVGPSVAARLHELAEQGTHDVVVDLNDAHYIDTTVLDAFVTAQRELGDHQHALAVVADQPYARRTMEVTGLVDTLRLCRSRDEALQRLSS